jgi:hypothetical protein
VQDATILNAQTIGAGAGTNIVNDFSFIIQTKSINQRGT